MAFMVKFWGVRGSIACPAPDHMGYGGNTSCIEMTVGDNTLIFDAGTGIRALGRDLVRRGVHSAALLLTHTHWDHISGFPFFAPGFDPTFSFSIMAGHLNRQAGGIEAVLTKQMENPTFPVPLATMHSIKRFHDFTAGDQLRPFDGVLIRTVALNHPNGATGYRVEYGGKSVCYVTDTEHVPGQPDAGILDLIAGADVVIYDCTYTDDEFPAKVGWGHSTWQEGIRLCQAAGAKRLVIFHHDPDHDDATMATIEAQAQASWPGAVVAAREGMQLDLS